MLLILEEIRQLELAQHDEFANQLWTIQENLEDLNCKARLIPEPRLTYAARDWFATSTSNHFLSLLRVRVRKTVRAMSVRMGRVMLHEAMTRAFAAGKWQKLS